MIGLIYQRTHSMALAMAIPFGCYLVVGFFSFWGCEIRPKGERTWAHDEVIVLPSEQ
jgi:fucose permease